MKRNPKKHRRNERRKLKMTGNANTLTERAIDHATSKNKDDLRLGANKRFVIERASEPERNPPKEYEIIPGIGRLNYIPHLGRFGGDLEFNDALTPYLPKEAKIYYEVRTDRPPKRDGTLPLHKRTAKGHAGHFAANLPPHIPLVLRWARKEELPDPEPALRATVIYAKELTQSTYGVKALAVAFHTPNPYSYSGRIIEKWETPSADPDEEKIGGWNYHIQLYYARVVDERFIALHNRFAYFTPSQVALWWLDQYGVDIHYTTRCKAAYDYRADLVAKAKELPKRLNNAVIKGSMTLDDAITKAVERHMIVWDKKWPKRVSKTMQAVIKSRLAGKSTVQKPVDWFLSVEATKYLEAQLVALHPRYSELIQKGREVYRDIKTAHCACGYTKTLNSLLNEFEAKEEAANKQKKAERDAQERANRDEQILQQAREKEALKTALAAEVVEREKQALDYKCHGTVKTSQVGSIHNQPL